MSFGPTKTKRGRRTVPLPRGVIAELEAHMGAYVEPDAAAVVFRSTEGTPLRRGGSGGTGGSRRAPTRAWRR